MGKKGFLMFVKQNLSKFLHFLLKDKAIAVLSGPLKGWRWLPASGNHSYWLGTYEREYVTTFSRYVQPGHVVFDIGAQAGYFTLIASRLTGHDGQVVAFEPFPKNLRFIREHCRLNDCNNVKLLEVAVGGSSKKRRFQAKNSFMGHISNNGSLEVEVSPLDDLAAKNEISAPNVLKIDVEGMEYWVLQGGKNIIKNSRPTIFISTHGQANQSRVLQLLQEWNYEIFKIGKGSAKNADYLAKPIPLESPQ
jgi:FkbM family methyltransferase